MTTLAKKTPYLVRKGDRFYFRVRIPQDLREVIGKAEHSEALGDVNKAQAEVLAAQHGANWQERFLRERYTLGMTSAPPAEAPQPATPIRYATPEQARAVAALAGRALLAVDEEARIDGTRWAPPTPEEFGPGRPLATTLPAAVAGRDLEGIAMAAEDWLGAHGLTLPPAGTERRRVLYAYAQGIGKAGLPDGDRLVPLLDLDAGPRVGLDAAAFAHLVANQRRDPANAVLGGPGCHALRQEVVAELQAFLPGQALQRRIAGHLLECFDDAEGGVDGLCRGRLALGLPQLEDIAQGQQVGRLVGGAYVDDSVFGQQCRHRGLWRGLYNLSGLPALPVAVTQSVVTQVTPDEVKAALDALIQALQTAQGIAPAQRTEVVEVLEQVKAEADKEKPNRITVGSLIGGVRDVLEGLQAAPDAWKTVKDWYAVIASNTVQAAPMIGEVNRPGFSRHLRASN